MAKGPVCLQPNGLRTPVTIPAPTQNPALYRIEPQNGRRPIFATLGDPRTMEWRLLNYPRRVESGKLRTAASPSFKVKSLPGLQTSDYGLETSSFRLVP